METEVGVTTHKFVVVLNKKIETGVALNAACHMAACLVARASGEARQHMQFVDYVDGDGGIHPVSALSLVVLRADNANQLRVARTGAIEHGLLYVDFTESMTRDTYVEQMERTRQIKEADLDYWGLCIFGPREVVGSITKKFSLWR